MPPPSHPHPVVHLPVTPTVFRLKRTTQWLECWLSCVCRFACVYCVHWCCVRLRFVRVPFGWVSGVRRRHSGVSNCDGGRRLRVRLLSSSQSLGYTFVQYVPLVLQLWTLPESNLVYATWTFKMVCTKGQHTPSPSALTGGWVTSLGKVCLHALDQVGLLP